MKTLEDVKKARVDLKRYYDFIKNLDPKGILIFAPDTYHKENQLNVRFFIDYMGVPEDPATGSANGCLAGYLVEHRYFGQAHIDLRVEQGHELGRPSLLLLKAEAAEGGIEVRVGGRVQMVARGELV